MTIYNPFDTFVNAQGNLERRPFRGTSFRRACWIRSPSALAYFPLPNTPSTSITETNNWFGQGIRERQPPDEHQDGSQLLGAEPPERPLQLWSVLRRRLQPFRRTGPAFPSTTARSSAASIPSSPSSPDTEFDSALERALRVDVRTFIRDPIESFDLTQLGLPA